MDRSAHSHQPASVDQFRSDFFDHVIQVETEKEQQRKRQQANCAHTYTIIGQSHSGTYQQRTSSKCDHSAVRRIQVWEGTKRCIIC